MKQKLTLIFLLFFIFNYAQDKVVVEYSYKNSFDISIVKDEHLLNLYKNSNEIITYYTLFIDKNEAVFEDVQRVNNSQEMEKPAISGPLGKTYLNLETREYIYEADYNGKYIIKDLLNIVEWKIERERGTHLGYETRKATYKNDYLEYEAWFVPSLSLKFGPNGYGELPGLIVKFTHYFNNKNGRHHRTFIADKISIEPQLKILKPTKGKVVSQKEFNKIVEEQNKKFEEIKNNKVETKID
ncbi:GLPGLI family protein [Faecalibacter macacae]|uniref:GLPGLI family protein n=1 Tax=Faecalibacter macacae TaxID=1859289 RepID=A0A3L9M9Y1_9FLAO|nr:GLPGLI family protein [Faecalibacter macacae]RLZ08766.1 GLPGLI family protein [Faecalibacter macacae]